MAEEKQSKYRGFTPTQAEAHKRYMEMKFLFRASEISEYSPNNRKYFY